MSWLRRLKNTLRPNRVNDDIAREISFHLAERRDQLRAEGLSQDESARRARLQFGNVGLQSERTRDVDIALWIDAALRNIRYAFRTLARTPGFTIAVVLTLALGIGANSAVFSAVDAVLLQPLPFPDGDRLMRLTQVQDRGAETNIAPVRLEEWNRMNATFEAITGYYMENVSETSGDLPERVRCAWVAPRFLEVWGVSPAIGRGFADADHREGTAFAVLISDRYWRSRFNGDPNVLNRTVRVGSASVPIVGVMPASFLFPDREVDLWFPVRLNKGLAQARHAMWYTGIGRLKPGVTVDQATANLRAVQAQLAETFPNTDRTIRVDIVPLKETMIGDVRGSLWLLFGAVSVLLLITCTNIAALLLSRGAHRRQEMSVRLSLGATRRALAGQMLIETGVLALAGSAVGLLVGVAASRGLQSAAIELPRMDEIALDSRILAYTLGLALAVTFACGLLPAVRTARGVLAGAAKDTRRTQVSSRQSLQWLLVGVQVALSVTLLAGAGLLARSFLELSRVDPGFESSRILAFRVSGSWAETADYPRLIARIETTIEELRSVPGVESVASSAFLPGVPEQYEITFEIAGARDDSEKGMVAERRYVSPEYFRTMEIPVVSGRLCAPQRRDGVRETMVNRAFEARLSTRPSALGLDLTRADSTDEHHIVGIVGNARERGLDRDPGPVVYSCISAPNPTPYLLVRTRGEPAAVAQSVRLRMKALEPARAVYDIAPLQDRIGDAFAQNRLRTVLLALFAVTALLLACVGLYGTLSHAVNARRREVGLRMALGARRVEVVRLFLMRALLVAGVGCGVGVMLSLGSARALSRMLYGVSASDPVTLGGVVAVVLVVAGLSALVPATRAALVEPMRVLRDE